MLQRGVLKSGMRQVAMALVFVGVAFSFATASGAAAAPEKSNPYEVLLHSRRFVPKANINDYLRSGERRGVLQFTALPTEERHAELQASGIELHDYLPNLAYTASIGATVNAHDLSLLGVRAWFPLEPDDRLSADLRNGKVGAWAKPSRREVDLIILRYPDFPEAQAMSVVSALGGSVLDTATPFRQLTVRMPLKALRELADQSWVLWIETIPPPPVVHNDGSRKDIDVDPLQVPPYNLTGAGVRVAVFENFDIDAHPDLAGRVTISVPGGTVDEHATHVAGTLAGDGTLSGGLLRGMAPKASLFSWAHWTSTFPMNQLTSVTTQATVISQNSWGWGTTNLDNNCGTLGDYHWSSNAMDQIVRVNSFATYRSAGNERTFDCAPLTYGTINQASTAKNVVTVGAINKFTPNGPPVATAPWSGWGPTDDGRLKPDLVAVGMAVKSTCESSTYCTLYGTSMAAPAVSGTAALLMEYFRRLNASRDPTPALVKAILLNTAIDLGPEGPDFQFGYGKPDALRAANTIRDSRFLNGRISALQTRTISFNATTSPQCSVKVLLAYTDREGAPNATRALVNDLDLKLVSPNGSTYLPLTLNPSRQTALARRAVNTRDNVEQVTVPGFSPANPWLPGIWKVVVTGTKIPFGPQPFSLTWQAEGPSVPCSFELPGGCAPGLPPGAC